MSLSRSIVSDSPSPFGRCALIHGVHPVLSQTGGRVGGIVTVVGTSVVGIGPKRNGLVSRHCSFNFIQSTKITLHYLFPLNILFKCRTIPFKLTHT